ncbi:MAG: type II toxin-antitoxin system death-on-curing family toxin [Aquisalinus sp.]|nr:type II toxin-antitoxin system death-on-curing family toxin [Aquisalinus sp.]
MTVLWLSTENVMSIHQRSLADHGGAEGVRDPGLLESALEKPKQRFFYGEPSIHELATVYASGIVKNHAFVDGNKRTAFLTAYVFLGVNGYELDAEEAEAAAITLDLAASKVTEDDYAKWLEINCTPVE